VVDILNVSFIGVLIVCLLGKLYFLVVLDGVSGLVAKQKKLIFLSFLESFLKFRQIQKPLKKPNQKSHKSNRTINNHIFIQKTSKHELMENQIDRIANNKTKKNLKNYRKAHHTSKNKTESS
jgi:hypothetical protein